MVPKGLSYIAKHSDPTYSFIPEIRIHLSSIRMQSVMKGIVCASGLTDKIKVRVLLYFFGVSNSYAYIIYMANHSGHAI
jgi:hypothetical protein